MEDCCAGCYRHLATITPACGHRLYCNDCFLKSIQNRKTCGICNQPIKDAEDTSLVQLKPVTLRNVIDDFNDLKIDYPFGFMLMGTNEEMVDSNMYYAVEEAMYAVNANRLQLDQLKRALRRRLTMEQYQLIFVKFIEDSNFHDILLKLDRRQFEKREYTKTVQRLVVRSIESTDNKAILARACVTTALGELIARSYKYGPYTEVACEDNAILTGTVFYAFTAIEIYRWSKGLVNGKNALKNIGEHAVGSTFGHLGFGAATELGATPGTVWGSLLGGVLGTICDYVSRKAYRQMCPGEKVEITEEQVKEEIKLSQREIVDKAAKKFGIDVDIVSFPEAQGTFRRMLLATHPDKHPGISDEEKARLTDETRDIIACWVIVREYYNDKGGIEDSDCDEAFINVWALKVYDAVTDQWRTVRTFFESITLGREVNPTTERLEQTTIYV